MECIMQGTYSFVEDKGRSVESFPKLIVTVKRLLDPQAVTALSMPRNEEEYKNQDAREGSNLHFGEGKIPK
jgi:hypothetical protein